jgi:nicotinamide-nucleotide amidase
MLPMQAVILSIGDELVLGQNIDTNSAYLSQHLAGRGIGTLYHQSVADDLAAITKAIHEAAQTVELVIITGGLGPTEDDLTRQALADAMGVDLVEHQPSIDAITAMYAKRGKAMPERNRVQALHPRGTDVIPNHWGTAPGIHAKLHKADIYAMPGVPREMYSIYENLIAPAIERLSGDRQAILTHKINTFGLGESDVAQKLGPLMDRSRNPKVGTTVSDAIVAVRLRSEFNTTDEARRQLDDTIQQVRQILGPVIFGEQDQTLAQSLVAMLLERKLVLATAESCTAGLIAKMVTDVPGCSDIFAGGWVTYTNAMKASQLGVDEQTLAIHGAVSEPVARQMALGAINASNADFALSTTGLAGPTGGTPEKPVGTVWIGLAVRDRAADQVTVEAREYVISGNRDDIRDRASKCALQMLRFHLRGLSVDSLTWSRRLPATSAI